MTRKFNKEDETERKQNKRMTGNKIKKAEMKRIKNIKKVTAVTAVPS